MRRKILWVAAALVLIAIPAAIGLVALRGDGDSSRDARRTAALIQLGSKGGAAGYQLVVPPITPSGHAIQVESFSWGVANAGAAAGSGMTAGKASFKDLRIVKQIDQTSPLFAMHVANGKHLNTAVLTLIKATASGPVEYAKYTLENVLIGEVQHSGNADAIPMEEVSLNYGTIKTEIASLDNTGKLGGQELFGWNLAENVAVSG